MRLIVLSENFGLNFSGGCIATAKFLETLEKVFDTIIVLAKEVGNHHLRKVKFIKYNLYAEIPSVLLKYRSANTIGYGDFYIAEHFIEAKIPFFFTYHDNFPDIIEFELHKDSFIEERMKCYKNIFRKAAHIFSVSNAKIPFIEKYTKRFSLVRNGVFQNALMNEIRIPKEDENVKVLMAGNIETRKYKVALDLFSILEKKEIKNIEIDIYGLLNDKLLVEKISEFSFVYIKGFSEIVPFNNYHLYLNTSVAENLSIAVVDAIANRTPVITFDVGGLSEVINKNNGYTIPAFDVNTMATKITEFDFKYFAKNFDKTTIKDFDWQKGALKMQKVMLNHL